MYKSSKTNRNYLEVHVGRSLIYKKRIVVYPRFSVYSIVDVSKTGQRVQNLNFIQIETRLNFPPIAVDYFDTEYASHYIICLIFIRASRLVKHVKFVDDGHMSV